MALDEFRIRIEAWTAELLAEYVPRLAQRKQGDAPKEFNDPVWGTIVLQPIELVILDSPLLQRLRFVRQLGVAQLVYPAANHTRLEHTLGVVHQVDRLVRSLNEHFRGSGPAVTDDQLTLLRLAALVHDIGHGAMSHVSENALENFEGVKDLRDEFSESEGVEDTALGELVAHLAVGSASFQELLSEAKRISGVSLPDDAVSRLQTMIIGGEIDTRVPLLHELISGPFDADKLDYMTRDAFMTGVPVVTDIPRLVQKVRAIELPEAELPPRIAKRVTENAHASYIVTGISLSGGRTLDELMFGQVLLRDKIYRHSKVRAAEAMIASIFREIAELVPEGPAMLPYLVHDEDLLRLDVETVERLARRELSDDEVARVRTAVEISKRLCERQVFVRAFAFALRMPLDPYNADVRHYSGLEQVVRNSDDFGFRGRLVGLIAAETAKICELVAPEVLEQTRDLKPYIWLDPPVRPTDTTETLHAYLIVEQRGKQDVLRFTEGIQGASRWSDAYLLTRDTGYIFTTAELAVYVHIASEVVLRREHGIRTPKSMRAHIKQDTERLDDIRRQLDDKGYFSTLPYDVRPTASRLRRADVRGRINGVLERLRGYDGPVDSRGDKGQPLLNAERVKVWLSQFPAEFGDEPLKLLEELQIVARPQFVNALERFLTVAEERFANPAVCPLGSAKDSSAIATYYAKDVEDETGLRVMELGEALGTDRPVVFLDDFIGSGQQSLSILENWLGVEPSTDLGESRSGPLSAVHQQALRDRPLGFAFAAGLGSGRDLLESAFERLGIDGTVLLADDPPAPRAFDANGGAVRSDLKEFCARVGDALLDDGDAKHDADWRSKRLLGYGNEGFLITSGYNTPTQTLTCLWKDGTFEGIDWMPLLPRRRKT